MKNNIEEKITEAGWILRKKYLEHAELRLYQSPWDGKYHIYDDYAEELLDKAFDRVEKVFSNYNIIYLAVTLNGKQGLYHYSNYKKGKGFMTKIEYDHIKSLSNLLVFTKDGKKRFAYVYEEEKLSEEFDDITMDENHKNLIYCKKENTIHVFDTRKQDFLFSMNVEELSNLYENTFWIQSNNHRLNEYLFKTKKEGQYGLTKIRIEYELGQKNNVETETLLKEEYNQIEEYCEIYKIEKDGKQGLYDPSSSTLIEPKYDQIVTLYSPNTFAFYHDGLCDIGRMTTKGWNLYVTDCKTTYQYGELMDILTYQKNGKLGILFIDDFQEKVIPAIYDSITHICGCTFIVEQNQKKGLFHNGELVIPPVYDEIKVGQMDDQNLFVTLKKEGKYKVAKMPSNYFSKTTFEYIREESFDSIEYYPDLIVMKSQDKTYIYDYQRGLLIAYPSNILIQYYEDEDTQNRCYFVGSFYFYYHEGKMEEKQKNLCAPHYALTRSLYSTVTSPMRRFN